MEYWDYYLLRLLEYAITKATPETDSMMDSTLYTVEEIKLQGLQKRNKPILTDTLKPGLYRSFAEFQEGGRYAG